MRSCVRRTARTLHCSSDSAPMFRKPFASSNHWKPQNARRTFRKISNGRNFRVMKEWITQPGNRRGIFNCNNGRRKSVTSLRKRRGSRKRLEDVMNEYENKPKQPKATEVIANQPRRDNNGPDKGGGDPHMNWDDKPLSESETWKSHKPAKEPKSAKKSMTIVIPTVPPSPNA